MQREKARTLGSRWELDEGTPGNIAGEHQDLSDLGPVLQCSSPKLLTMRQQSCFKGNNILQKRTQTGAITTSLLRSWQVKTSAQILLYVRLCTAKEGKSAVEGPLENLEEIQRVKIVQLSRKG